MRVVVTNTASRLVTEDTALLRRLSAAFKFRVKDFEFRAGAGARGWRGYVPFVSVSSRSEYARFQTGLVPAVTGFLRDRGLAFTVQDDRVVPPATAPLAPVTRDLVMPYRRMHAYQVDVANQALAAQRGIVKCATGGGKTLIMAAMLRAVQAAHGTDMQAVVLFRNRTLVNQTAAVLEQAGVARVGVVHMDRFDPQRVTCATIQSAHRIKPELARASVLVVDEVHEFATPLSLRVLRATPRAYYRWGFSATPFRPDDLVHQHRLIGVFGPLVSDVSTAALQAQDILAEAAVRFITVTEPQDIQHLDYMAAEEAGVHGNEHLHDIVARMIAAIPAGRVMVLVRRIAHGDALAARIPGAMWISGRDDAATREFVLQQLRSSRRRKVVAIVSSIGFVGVDVFVHHLFDVSGGRHPNMTIQKVGRGLRKAQDKSLLHYYDFLHLTNPHLQAHSEQRMQTLLEEQHDVVVDDSVTHYLSDALAAHPAFAPRDSPLLSMPDALQDYAGEPDPERADARTATGARRDSNVDDDDDPDDEHDVDDGADTDVAVPGPER